MLSVFRYRKEKNKAWRQEYRKNGNCNLYYIKGLDKSKQEVAVNGNSFNYRLFKRNRRGYSLRLAKDGFDIALNDLNEGMFENNDIAEKIREFGVKCEIFLADVSDYSQCEEMVGSIREKFGGLDVLVNNAGITKDGLMARMSEEQYDKVIAVNQKSVFNMMKLAGKIMMKQRSGRIINMASVAVFTEIRGRSIIQPLSCRYRNDKDRCQGAWLKRRRRQRRCSGIYKNSHDR